MFAEWVTVGVGLGVKIFFAAFTVLAIAGVFIGICSLILLFTRGETDEKNDTETRTENYKPRH